MRAEDLLGRLHGVRPTGRGWVARCPGHEDRHPSLSVTHRGDRLLVHCFGGCSLDAILSALGLKVADLFSEKPQAVAAPGSGSSPTPATAWATVRREIQEERRALMKLEGEVADAIRRAHGRIAMIRRAVTALGRDDDKALDLLADAAALERAVLAAEATLDEMRAEGQEMAFAIRGG